MAKVGRFVIDPKAGAYCQIVLDSGEKIIVNHDKGGFKGGRLTIEVSKLMGFSSDQIFVCDLNSREGAAALARITADAKPDSVQATPLGAFVNHVKGCRSAAEVKTRCASLLAGQ
jgi:prolyl-tRNA synthetase